MGTLENMTSAEFKIIICKHAWLGIQRKAAKFFKKYGLEQKTLSGFFSYVDLHFSDLRLELPFKVIYAPITC